MKDLAGVLIFIIIIGVLTMGFYSCVKQQQSNIHLKISYPELKRDYIKQ